MKYVSLYDTSLLALVAFESVGTVDAYFLWFLRVILVDPNSDHQRELLAVNRNPL